MISGSDLKMMCTKALEVMSFVDKELGFSTQYTVLPTTKKVCILLCLVKQLLSKNGNMFCILF